jgi:hypothetical protein
MVTTVIKFDKKLLNRNVQIHLSLRGVMAGGLRDTASMDLAGRQRFCPGAVDGLKTGCLVKGEAGHSQAKVSRPSSETQGCLVTHGRIPASVLVPEAWSPSVGAAAHHLWMIRVKDP